MRTFKDKNGPVVAKRAAASAAKAGRGGRFSAGSKAQASWLKVRNLKWFGEHIMLPGMLKDEAREKILVVDDEPDIVRIVTKSLAGDGYEVITANDGAECIAKAEDELPALILLDSVMPNMDGQTALLRLKATRKTESIPVIMVTALAGGDDIANAQKNGATDYVVKPFDYYALLKKITRALESKRRGLE